MVNKSTTDGASLAQLEPFAIRKGIDCISMDCLTINIIKGDQVPLLTKNAKVVLNFLKAKSLARLCSIECSLHNHINRVKGIIYDPLLKTVPIQEIT